MMKTIPIVFSVFCTMVCLPLRADEFVSIESLQQIIDTEGIETLTRRLDNIDGRLRLTSEKMETEKSKLGQMLLRAAARSVEYSPSARPQLDELVYVLNQKLLGLKPDFLNSRKRLPQERQLVTIDNQPVTDIPIRLMPVEIPAAKESPGFFALFYVDDAPPNHPAVERNAKEWGNKEDRRGRAKMNALYWVFTDPKDIPKDGFGIHHRVVGWLIRNAMELIYPDVQILRDRLSDFSPGVADFVNARTNGATYSGGNTHDGRLMGLYGIQRAPLPNLIPAERAWENRLREGMSSSIMTQALRDRALNFVEQESKSLRAQFDRGAPITMIAIGQWDGGHHELMAVRKVYEELPADERDLFLKKLRIYFCDPDTVGEQIGEMRANIHGLPLMPAVDLDPTKPAEGRKIRDFVAKERKDWNLKFPNSPEAHVRITFVGSAGEYKWGNMKPMADVFWDAGVDALHGSYYRRDGAPVTDLLVRTGRKGWEIYKSAQAVVKMLKQQGFAPHSAKQIKATPLMPFAIIEVERCQKKLRGIGPKKSSVVPVLN